MKENFSEISDLISNDSFREFVLNSNAGNKTYWERWIKDHPEKLKSVQLAMDFIRTQYTEQIELGPDEIDIELERFAGYMEENTKQTKLDDGNSGRSIAPVYIKRIMVAASVLLIPALLTYLYIFQNSLPETSSAERSVVYIEKKTPKGIKTTLKLPDGSIVKLNADSKLTFPENFPSTIREVTLEGEAFFEIRKDSLRPFIVKTDKLSTSVLGTSFNVKAYTGDNVEVALVTGKVKVSGNSSDIGNVQLLPTEMAIYNQNNQSIEKTVFNPIEKLAWRENTLYFNNSSFEDIIKMLERWYGIDFVIKRPHKIEERFTGNYKNESLKSVLNGMSFSLDFQFEIQDKTVIIK
ncbi:FecR family protein [Fulvivirgaceae bacterium BMA12]|uniref:FecR family protein n=1 Tax=Agaribacillus aureus TaxID=3051825 RepID=A0ABT8L5M9_9BACT|nr:FecR family protein [Fulvivirgaceae bacterium BMA12]